MRTRTAYEVAGLAFALCLTLPAPAQKRPATKPRPIDLVICLDTSGSMKGLIDAARQNIWAIVNDLALAKPAPKLRLALFTFGNDGHPKGAGWVKRETPLTEDLDLVSQRLFALTTNGGTEYVGRVLQAALAEVAWTRDRDALELILVAGNEGADQDKAVDYRAMCRKAIARGILVNSIYCGNPADAVAPGWRDVAKLADGQFASIDQGQNVVIATPFDAKLTELSSALNGTYIPFGAKGKAGKDNQQRQDANARNLNRVAGAQRAMTKSSSGYVCAWDLCDSYQHKRIKLADLKEADLPEDMRKMTVEQRKAHIEKTLARRAAIQKQIADLHAKRQKHIAKEQKKVAAERAKTFEFQVRKAIRAQAEAKGFRYR